MQWAEVNKDQVGAAARGQRAGQMSDMKRLGAEARRHEQSLRSRERSWVIRHSFGNKSGEANLLKHIQIFIGSRSICTDAYVEPLLKHYHYRCKNGSILEI